MDENLNDFLVGKWKSEPLETEMGVLTIEIAFRKDTFRVENYFGESETPVVIKGAWKLAGSALTAESWNKGNPIKVSTEDDKLVLQTGDDPPVTLSRAK